VNFIDYEYTAYNYEAHDIAMHFCDYAGNENYVYLMSVLTLSTVSKLILGTFAKSFVVVLTVVEIIIESAATAEMF